MKEKDIKNYNDKGLWHGYQERYSSDKLYLRAIYKHGQEIGYEEWHGISETNYYIK